MKYFRLTLFNSLKINAQNIIPNFIKQRFNERIELQKIFVNFSWLLFDKVVRLVVSIVVFSWTARYLGPEKFGIWNYAIAFVALLAPISTLGLNTIVVKELVKAPDQKGVIVGTTFVLKLVGSILTFIVASLAIYFKRSDDLLTQQLVAIVAIGFIFQSFDAIDLYFQAVWKSNYTVIAKTSGFLVSSAIKVALILLKFELIYFVWVSVFEYLIGSILLIFNYTKDNQKFKYWRFNWKTAKWLLYYSWPLVISSISITIQAYIDQIMLGDMIGDHELGQFAAANKLVLAVSFIPMIIQSSVAPDLTMAKQKSEDLYYYKLQKIYQLMFFLFVIIAIPTILFSDFIISVFYGADYKAAGFILSLLIFRLFFANMGVAKSLLITNDNLFKYSLVTSLTGSIINVVLNYILIPHYSSVGAIISTIISLTVTIFVVDIFFKPVHRNLRIMLLAIFDIRSYADWFKKI